MDLLQGQTLSYPGWQADKVEAENLYRNSSNISSLARQKLIGMKNKQRLHDGDRTHPDIVALDNTIFTYHGWQDDKQEAERCHTAHTTLPGCLLLETVQAKLAKMKMKQQAHTDRSSVPFLAELDSQVFSYTGWQDDKKEAEQMYHANLNFRTTKLQGMKNKQRLSDGDRSHAEIVALDTAIFTYDGWQVDKEEAERIHTTTTILFGCPTPYTVPGKLAEMKRKQAMHCDRSSIPFLCNLDSCTFSYRGWQADKAEAEKFHQIGSAFAPKKLIGMKNKQRLLVDNDRSHPELVALDSTIFTYPGWQEDKLEAESIHTTTTVLRGLQTLGTVQDKVEMMKKKQIMHSNRSSVAFLRDLDAVSPRQAQQQPTQVEEGEQPPPPPPQQPPSPPRRASLLECNRVKRVCAETTRTTAAASVEEAPDDDSDKKAMDPGHCVICWDNEPSHAYIPCGHRCICANCASTVGVAATSQESRNELKCPMCRVTAMCITKIFL